MSVTTDDVVTYKARLNVDNGELLLRPGMTATVAIVVERGEGCRADRAGGRFALYARLTAATRSVQPARPVRRARAWAGPATDAQAGRGRHAARCYVLKEGVPAAVTGEDRRHRRREHVEIVLRRAARASPAITSSRQARELLS